MIAGMVLAFCQAPRKPSQPASLPLDVANIEIPLENFYIFACKTLNVKRIGDVFLKEGDLLRVGPSNRVTRLWTLPENEELLEIRFVTGSPDGATARQSSIDMKEAP